MWCTEEQANSVVQFGSEPNQFIKPDGAKGSSLSHLDNWGFHPSLKSSVSLRSDEWCGDTVPRVHKWAGAAGGPHSGPAVYATSAAIG